MLSCAGSWAFLTKVPCFILKMAFLIFAVVTVLGHIKQMWPRWLCCRLWHQGWTGQTKLEMIFNQYLSPIRIRSNVNKKLVYLFFSLRREISWVCSRICFSSWLVSSEYSSSWISRRLVWFNTYGVNRRTVGAEGRGLVCSWLQTIVVIVFRIFSTSQNAFAVKNLATPIAVNSKLNGSDVCTGWSFVSALMRE